MSELRSHSVAFSGHRTFKMRDDTLFSLSSAEDSIASRLDKQLDLLFQKGYRIFLCGMAEGFDLEAAEAVLRLKARNRNTRPPIQLHAVIPYPRQAERFSPADRMRYRSILDQTDQCILLSPAYHPGCFHVRNDYLIDHASLLLCYYNGSKGGTQYTVRRALKKGLPISNLYP